MRRRREIFPLYLKKQLNAAIGSKKFRGKECRHNALSLPTPVVK